jgi:transcriptional regulator with XRE-family HTH domain
VAAPVASRRGGPWIRELREAKDWSQEEFADRCGLHRTAIGLLERAERIPRLDTLVTISEGFGITVSELLLGPREAKSFRSEAAATFISIRRDNPRTLPVQFTQRLLHRFSRGARQDTCLGADSCEVHQMLLEERARHVWTIEEMLTKIRPQWRMFLDSD